MEVLASRLLVHPVNLDVSRRFYRDVLGLAIFREYGDSDNPGVVFFLGGGYLELAPPHPEDGGPTNVVAGISLWLQVRDLAGEHQRLVDLDVPIKEGPRREPWGLLEMWITDPDGVPIVLVEVPGDHPLRRDTRA